MPPQGESTGIAIEDGILLARVLRERHATHTIRQLVATYEAVRRPTIDKLHRETTARWNHAAAAQGIVQTVAVEWLTRAYMNWAAWKGDDYFAPDVRTVSLPS